MGFLPAKFTFLEEISDFFLETKLVIVFFGRRGWSFVFWWNSVGSIVEASFNESEGALRRYVLFCGKFGISKTCLRTLSKIFALFAKNCLAGFVKLNFTWPEKNFALSKIMFSLLEKYFSPIPVFGLWATGSALLAKDCLTEMSRACSLGVQKNFPPGELFLGENLILLPLSQSCIRSAFGKLAENFHRGYENCIPHAQEVFWEENYLFETTFIITFFQVLSKRFCISGEGWKVPSWG